MPKKLDDYVVCSVGNQAYVCVDYCYRVGYVPQTFQDAVRCVESSDWHQAMDSEMESLVQSDTFNVEELPKGKTDWWKVGVCNKTLC